MPDSSPIWDLTDLYSNIEDSAIAADLEASRASAKSLAAAWRGRLGEVDGQQLATLITDYERVLETLGKAASHAQLQFAANTTDADIARHHQSIREAGAEIGAELLFVELELATLPQARIDELCETEAVAAWMPWLRRVRAMAPYQLDPDMERMLAERAPTGRGAWVRLFDETAASLR
ncbi:MAG: oligoendopeptidase F, partial [Candidatus Puniceispirillaceae bacterium]